MSSYIRTASAGARRFISVVGFAASLSLGAAMLTLGAEASSIKVIVNDQAITSMDVQGRAKLLQVASHLSPGAAVTAAQDELIDEALRLQAATSRGIIVPQSRVDQAITEIASHSKMTPAQFAAALGHAGVPIQTLKDRLRVQMAWAQLVRARLQQQMRSQNADLITQMRNQEKAADSVSAYDYVVQKVVVVVPKNAPAAIDAQRKRDAEALRSKFVGCDQGLAFARALKDVAVVNVGRRLAAEVPPGLRQDFIQTSAGRLTPPQQSDYGYEMYAICDKTPVSGEAAVGASSFDAEALNKQGEELSKKMTQELRQKANITIR